MTEPVPDPQPTVPGAWPPVPDARPAVPDLQPASGAGFDDTDSGADSDGSGATRARRRPWQRPTSGERRWPMALGVVIAVLLQLVLPDRHIVQPAYVFPAVELALLVALIVGDPGRIDRRSTVLRRLTMALILVMTVDNLLAVIELVDGILTGASKDTATVLLATGAAIWLTNVITFSLWYWELDRGGPAARATGASNAPAFTFPEMQHPSLVAERWMPQYVDYAFLSFTNATAFSPTDTLPLRPWAKLMMMAQSAISLVVGIMIISRAINVLT